jgi:hypothetical protein
MISALRNTTKQGAVFVAQALFGTPQSQTQRAHLETADVAQLHPLEVVPHAFDGVQLEGHSQAIAQMYRRRCKVAMSLSVSALTILHIQEQYDSGEPFI